MKRHCFPRKSLSLPGVLIGVALLFAISASAQSPSIEGTYQFISRQLPDGTMLKPPDIMGICTYSKSHRTFNTVRRDASGEFSSTSLVSTYKLTTIEYSETLLFSIRNNIGGKGIVYDLLGKTQSVPVNIEGGRIQFKMPLERPTVTFEGNKIIATVEGGFVDLWERAQ